MWEWQQFAESPDSNITLLGAASDVPDSYIASKYMVITSKGDRRHGTKEGRSILRDTMCAISKHPFGVLKPYIRSAEGETTDINTNRDMYIQDEFAMNLAKVEALNERLWNHDLKRIFYLSAIKAGVNPEAALDLSVNWNNEVQVEPVVSLNTQREEPR